MENRPVIHSMDERGVVTIRLNRPEVHNAFDEQFIAVFSEILDEVNHNDTARVVVLKAEGKSFSAGADLNWMKRMVKFSEEDNLKDAKLLSDMLDKLNTLKRPTIAEIQGPAFGGGIGLIACCDIAIATQTSSFCFSEVRLGLIPAVISPYVINAIGQRAARRYFLSAEHFTSQQALEINLIHEISTTYDIENRTSEIVSDILKNGPTAVMAAKSLIHTLQTNKIDNTIQNETSQLIAKIRTSEEGQEGLRAFLTKRKPHWIKTENHA